jgi:hypothetical protein
MLKTEYLCWECGSKAHWLDGNDSLEEKYQKLTDGYCGC